MINAFYGKLKEKIRRQVGLDLIAETEAQTDSLEN